MQFSLNDKQILELKALTDEYREFKGLMEYYNSVECADKVRGIPFTEYNYTAVKSLIETTLVEPLKIINIDAQKLGGKKDITDKIMTTIDTIIRKDFVKSLVESRYRFDYPSQILEDAMRLKYCQAAVKLYGESGGNGKLVTACLTIMFGSVEDIEGCNEQICCGIEEVLTNADIPFLSAFRNSSNGQ